MFDPGEKWEYGINIDWVGRLVEELSGQDLNAYCRDHICAPLGMADTGYVPMAEQQARQAAGHHRSAKARHRRDPDPNPFFRRRSRRASVRPVRAQRIQRVAKLREGSNGDQTTNPPT